jgi:hypothetical protein
MTGATDGETERTREAAGGVSSASLLPTGERGQICRTGAFRPSEIQPRARGRHFAKYVVFRCRFNCQNLQGKEQNAATAARTATSKAAVPETHHDTA